MTVKRIPDDQGITGVWSDWVPVIKQNGVTQTITIQQARYTTIGRTVFVEVRLTITSLGTAGFSIQSSLPVPVHNTATIFGMGAFFYRDLSALVDYRGVGVIQNDTTMAMRRGDTTVQSDIGVNPAIACDNGDIMSYGVWYESA